MADKLDTIDKCETAFNHHIGHIKSILDKMPNQSDRLHCWQFASIGVAFIESVLGLGMRGILIAWENYTEMVQEFQRNSGE